MEEEYVFKSIPIRRSIRHIVVIKYIEIIVAIFCFMC